MSNAILVTGAHGAIGSWLVRELVRRGRRVVGLDLTPDPVTPFDEFASTRVERVDVRDIDGIRRLMREEGVARIVNLAAIIDADRDPALAIEVNALAAVHLFDLAAADHVERVIAMSTKGVLGSLDPRYLHPRYEPVPVDHPPGPRTIYETTKYLVEVAIRHHRDSGRDMSAVRLASTWGPGKSAATHGQFGLHGEVLAAALRGEASRVDVHPEQGYDLVYYADVAAGLADLTLAPSPLPHPAYHLGSGRITTMGQFAQEIERAFPGVEVETGDTFASSRQCLLDIGPAARDAGYEPRWTVERALAHVRELVEARIVS